MSGSPGLQLEPTAPAAAGSPFAHPAAAAIAVALIKRFEDLCLTPQPDTGRRWQIGYGCNFLPGGALVTAHTPPITQDQAEAMLQARLAEFARETDTILGDAPILDRQRGSCYSFGWNEGVGNLRGSSLLRYARAGLMDKAAAEFASWVYAGGKRLRGLEIRRAVEAAVFSGTITPEQIPTWTPPA
jgi:lysozyme